MDRAAVTFGSRLRQWRAQRGLTQLALALSADVSARHLSWLEGGKAEPSRAMVLRLCERLEVPLRERNAMLVAAGYAPMYGERGDDPAAQRAMQALQRLLDAHAPWPALAVDRHWNLVAHNATVPLLLRMAAPELLVPPVNVLRVSLHPKGLAPMIGNLAAWHAHAVHRVQRQLGATGDPASARLLDELRALRPPGSDTLHDEPALDDVAVTLVLNTPLGRLTFITTITVFGAPHDVRLSEIAVETLLPADEATADALRGLVVG
ncbi:MAG: helix-turn-helix transcriptional regulator [Rubrivivax sp.]|jgi:transcriptional regulator with XRE-family HTH domain|nr:helix-turn-helix transcriptional regulator [Rubrivivax sp.]